MKRYPWLKAPYQQLVAQHQQGRGHHAAAATVDGRYGRERAGLGDGRWLMCQQRGWPEKLRTVSQVAS